MPSFFDALDADLSAAVDATFGEAATIIPRVSAQYVAPSADSSRPQQTVRGVFTLAPMSEPIQGQVRGAEFSGTTRFLSGASEFWLARAEVASLGYKIRPGDAIRLDSRAGAPVYTIAAPHQTDTGDLNLILVTE
jgi:hypothetical protein